MVGDQSKSAWETEYFSGKIIPLDLLCNTKAVLCFTLTLHWGRGACCARGPGFLGAWIKNTSESAYTHNRARAHSNPPTQLLPPLCLPLRTCSELCSDFWFFNYQHPILRSLSIWFNYRKQFNGWFKNWGLSPTKDTADNTSRHRGWETEKETDRHSCPASYLTDWPCLYSCCDTWD